MGHFGPHLIDYKRYKSVSCDYLLSKTFDYKDFFEAKVCSPHKMTTKNEKYSRKLT